MGGSANCASFHDPEGVYGVAKRDRIGARSAASVHNMAPAHDFRGPRIGHIDPARAGAGRGAPASLGVPAGPRFLEELRASIVTVAAGAQRLMSIYTPDLEPEIYDQTPFLEIVKRFVLARSFAKVRVLLGDSTRLLRDGNRFVAMGRRLTSYIDIRVVQGFPKQPAPAYLIADDRAIVYRARTDQWNAVVDFNNPPMARLHLNEFDEVERQRAGSPAAHRLSVSAAHAP